MLDRERGEIRVVDEVTAQVVCLHELSEDGRMVARRQRDPRGVLRQPCVDEGQASTAVIGRSKTRRLVFNRMNAISDGHGRPTRVGPFNTTLSHSFARTCDGLSSRTAYTRRFVSTSTTCVLVLLRSRALGRCS